VKPLCARRSRSTKPRRSSPSWSSAARGEEIVIAKSGKPRALLVPLGDLRPLRVPGKGRGQWRVKRSFDAPLPKHVLDDFV
jgi:antitoxin (DNA-binding transcriptional repressor) of toxin-antitoxin stability system